MKLVCDNVSKAIMYSFYRVKCVQLSGLQEKYVEVIGFQAGNTSLRKILMKAMTHKRYKFHI